MVLVRDSTIKLMLQERLYLTTALALQKLHSKHFFTVLDLTIENKFHCQFGDTERLSALCKTVAQETYPDLVLHSQAMSFCIFVLHMYESSPIIFLNYPKGWFWQ